MRRSIPWFIAIAVLVLAVQYASSDPPRAETGKGVLAVLRADQPVAVKEVAGGRYEISFFAKQTTSLGHRVIEVGNDYVTVEDIAKVTETRIPVFSIKCVSVLKVGAK